MNLNHWIKTIMMDCITAKIVKSPGQMRILQTVHLSAPLFLSYLVRRISKISEKWKVESFGNVYNGPFSHSSNEPGSSDFFIQFHMRGSIKRRWSFIHYCSHSKVLQNV